MTISAILTLVGVAAVALASNYFHSKYSDEVKISIKKALDSAQIPIVTFQEGDMELNFLLDSGSSHSHISSATSKILIGTPIETDYTYATAAGSNTSSKIIESILKYKDKEFKVNLFVNEGLDSSFESVKDECGIQVHGILGNDFLVEHKYVIDYAKLVARFSKS